MLEEHEKHTASIGDEYRPLEIEWMERLHFKVMEDGSSQRIMPKEVSLVSPESAFRQRMRLVNFAPRTALNLLVWLHSQQEELERLAQEHES